MPSLKTAFLWIVVCGLGLSGCKKAATREDCEKLLDRYVEHRIHRRVPHASAELIAIEQRAARERAQSSDGFAQCPSDLTKEQIECGLNSWDPDSLERCLVYIPLTRDQSRWLREFIQPQYVSTESQAPVVARNMLLQPRGLGLVLVR